MRRRSRASSKLANARSRKTVAPRAANTPKTGSRRSATADHKTRIAWLERQLSESLEQQAATSEVLQIISSPQTSVTAVLDAVAADAVRLCEARNATIYLRDGDAVVIHAQYGPLRGGQIGTRRALNNDWVAGRAVREARTIHVPDLFTSDEYPRSREVALRYGHRATLAVPLIHNGTAVGSILVRRQQARPFTDKQIALVQNFAAQAVIAVENARLLNELRQRTNDLTESLEQQTATSDVLGVISSSPGQLQAVFDIILKNANRLCDAKFSALFIYENGLIRVPSHVDLPRQLAEHFHKRNDQPPIPGTAIETLIRTKRLIHIPDQRGSPGGLSSPATTLAGARTYLAVPLLKDGNVIGAIATFRQEVRPFTDKQIQLVQNFASQTVIAIENARLLNELRERTADLTESLEQQTATSEVLRVISSSSGNLQTVFDTMLTEATDLCEASYGLMWLREEDAFRAAALYGDLPQAYRDQWRSGTRYRPGPETILASYPNP